VTDAPSPRNTSQPMRQVAHAGVDPTPVALDTNRVGRRLSPRRVVAAVWRHLIDASTYQTDEGMAVVVCWCSPWLCLPAPKPRSADRRDHVSDRRAEAPPPLDRAEGRRL
jgi:hypothetical protein